MRELVFRERPTKHREGVHSLRLDAAAFAEGLEWYDIEIPVTHQWLHLLR
jgi:hypothetical protein